jgi:hypothetical protein
MSTIRITMRQIRESLRPHLQAKLSYNEVGRTLKISKSVVGKYLSLARVAGVDWNVALTTMKLGVSDTLLECYPSNQRVRKSHQPGSGESDQ